MVAVAVTNHALHRQQLRYANIWVSYATRIYATLREYMFVFVVSYATRSFHGSDDICGDSRLPVKAARICGDSRFQQLGGDDRFPQPGGDNKRFPQLRGDDRFPQLGGDNRLSQLGGDDRFPQLGGDDRVPQLGGDNDRFPTHGGERHSIFCFHSYFG